MGKHRMQGDGKRRRGDVGRAEWSRSTANKRSRNEDSWQAEKRQKVDGGDKPVPVYATQFTEEEIAAQERQPKRKVAVMIGYSGTGYKGMQVSTTEKTIEGDLFAAFVAAGAISKANADKPQKSSLVRCARTDKGVHAAGNVISLKLVIEDPEIVRKINEQLSPQIRVWGIERTNGSFSAYTCCDSRIYEYLIPTHCFIPPHPRSFLARNLVELAEENEDLEGYRSRQKDVASFWDDFDEATMQPIFKGMDQKSSETLQRVFYESSALLAEEDPELLEELRSLARNMLHEKGLDKGKFHVAVESGQGDNITEDAPKPSDGISHKGDDPLETLFRNLRGLQIKAKKAYRIHPDRLALVRSALSRYIGSHRFHNYTIDKSPSDKSANRLIKSFEVHSDPIIINDTEWLSLKVHGQSFMMHQIRKMVSMAALLVRSGCHEGRIQDTYLPTRLSIPKAPSLGLLLERPVFEGYNKKLEDFGRAKIDFEPYAEEIREFKQREIYERIFRVEEEENTFHAFFSTLDQTKSAQLFYLSSGGLEATKRKIPEVKGSKTDADAASSALAGADDGEGANEGNEKREVEGSGVARPQDDVDMVASDDEEVHDEGS